jgi:hypothetical protein
MILLFILIKLLSSTLPRRRRTVTTRTVTKTVYTPVTKAGPARTDPRTADRIRREQFKRSQAAADVIHYTQVKQDLLAAYNASGAASGDSEKAIRKRISYDNAIRRTEKQIENAAYNARRTGL